MGIPTAFPDILAIQGKSRSFSFLILIAVLVKIEKAIVVKCRTHGIAIDIVFKEGSMSTYCALFFWPCNTNNLFACVNPRLSVYVHLLDYFAAHSCTEV